MVALITEMSVTIVILGGSPPEHSWNAKNEACSQSEETDNHHGLEIAVEMFGTGFCPVARASRALSSHRCPPCSSSISKESLFKHTPHVKKRNKEPGDVSRGRPD
jgi:hypothetical protein